jgi:hypothetical protein
MILRTVIVGFEVDMVRVHRLGCTPLGALSRAGRAREMPVAEKKKPGTLAGHKLQSLWETEETRRNYACVSLTLA